jgi:hypothetical protein
MPAFNTWASQQDPLSLSPLDRLLNNYIQNSNTAGAYLMRGDPQGLWKDLNTPKPVPSTDEAMRNMYNLAIGSIAPVESGLSKFVPNVKSGEEFLVQHNLTPQKLIAANELGGMPVPSLGISKISEPVQGYGDISLIGSKEMAIPSAKNPVYKSDAYTKKAPQIDYNIDYKSQENLKSLLGDVMKKVPNSEHDFGNLVQNYKDRQYNDLLISKFLDEKGLLPTNVENTYKFGSDIQSLRSQNLPEYQNWLNNFENKLPEANVNVQERLFKGYTPSGNRKYVPVNLDNIIKEMKGGASTEGWNYGVGNVRALVTPKFKSLKEITSNRDRIVSNKDFAPIKDKFDEGYQNLVNRLYEINPKFNANDTMLDIAENKNFSILKDQYTNVPDSLKADIGTYYDSLKKMPTEYFEIKPQRAVGIGEFKGAIVPHDIPQQAHDILTNAGIQNIFKYTTEAEKKKLFEKFGNQMFQVGAPLYGADQLYNNGLLGDKK